MAEASDRTAPTKTVQPTAPTDGTRRDYKARPVRGEVDIAALHRDLSRRYPVIRAYLAK